ncbi:MAG: prepilin-type N-terminal cleavage/methylation domain-containing protein [Myxococcota bacterium]|nr:prepilin-type N-terminal cleavage/methylation domain-containing protein [Myxococcota bacterium]
MNGRNPVFGPRGGFTIVELLVSIVIAGAALVGVYYYYATVQYSMREQAKISQAQLSARLGMELLASDLQRAGYLATPNTQADPLVVPNPALNVIFHAILHRNEDPQSVTGNATANPNVNPDSLLLRGNYHNADEYLVNQIVAGGGAVFLQPLLAYPLPQYATGTGGQPLILDDEAFCRLFPRDALLRMVDMQGFMQFNPVLGCGGGVLRSVAVVPPIQQWDADKGPVFGGYCEGCRVNVVNGVLYRIEIDAADPAKSDLARWMVDANGNPIDGTREVVVEYAVDFQVWFRGAAGGNPPITVGQGPIPADDVVMVGAPAPMPPDGTPTAQPELLRSAIVRLVVRTRLEDPKFEFMPRAGFAERIRSIDVAPSPGAARVRSYTTEVHLANIALRNAPVWGGT